MLDIKETEVTIKSESDSEGIIVVEPLNQGYGSTLGSSIRRVLLSSLTGAAITSVKIDGVRHQFSTLDGLKEDIVEVILNLKKVRLLMESDSAVTLKLNAKGPKVVTAGDFELPAGVKITNPDQVIANLSNDKAKLVLSVTAELGEGYSFATERKSTEIGVIPIDANYSPIQFANYKVEETRVGRVTNFDRLVFELRTDGTVKPSVAFKAAAEILVSQFTMLTNPELEKAKPAKIVASLVNPKEDTMSHQDLALEELDLPVRLTNSLKSAGINTVGEYLETPKEKLLEIKNFGAKSIETVNKKLTAENIISGETEEIEETK